MKQDNRTVPAPTHVTLKVEDCYYRNPSAPLYSSCRFCHKNWYSEPVHEDTCPLATALREQGEAMPQLPKYEWSVKSWGNDAELAVHLTALTEEGFDVYSIYPFQWEGGTATTVIARKVSGCLSSDLRTESSDRGNQ